MITFWGIAVVVFLVIEGISFGLTSLWFAIGAITALVSALAGAPLWLQIVWFIIVSGATLAITRPLARKYVNSKRQATNADRVIGETAKVTAEIDNSSQTGAVLINGKYWTARSGDGEKIKEGESVTILRIDGVKLIVEKTGRESEATPPEEKIIAEETN